MQWYVWNLVIWSSPTCACLPIKTGRNVMPIPHHVSADNCHSSPPQVHSIFALPRFLARGGCCCPEAALFSSRSASCQPRDRIRAWILPGISPPTTAMTWNPTSHDVGCFLWRYRLVMAVWWHQSFLISIENYSSWNVECAVCLFDDCRCDELWMHIVTVLLKSPICQ